LVVTVASPNGGEKLYTGNPYLIEWTSSADPGTFDVFFSSDGVVFGQIPECSGLPGSARSCFWSAPGPPTVHGRIQVQADGGKQSGVSDESDGAFSIVPGTGTITVTQPGTGANWAEGTDRVVKWTHNLGPAARFDLELIELCCQNSTIATGVPAASATTGSYNWTVPASSFGSAEIVVRWSSNGAVGDTSASFGIPDPAIVVTRPNTALSWKKGTTQQIRWNHNLGTKEKVLIEVSRDGGTNWSTIAAMAANTGNVQSSYNWTVTGPVTTQGRIRVTWTENGAVTDQGNVNFSIVN
jgi:hypothetical protein